MATVFPDYEMLVMHDYQEKKSDQRISARLIHPTQAKLKEEAIFLCREKVSSRDEKIIKDFFEGGDMSKSVQQLMQQSDVDKFKPLSNFLKGITKGTDPKNIELLAWLIDFPDRPYDYTRNYGALTNVKLLGRPLEKTETTVTVEPGEIKEDEKTTLAIMGGLSDPIKDGDIKDDQSIDLGDMPHSGEVNEEGKRYADVFNYNSAGKEAKPKPTSRKVVVVGLLAFVLGGGAYWWKENKMLASVGRCMYWNVDHYEAVPCDQKMPNTMVLALDADLVTKFRKITRPDTITNQSKGRVWYSKINNVVEFFTADGVHPVVFGRKLKPATEYMIGKYAKNERDSIP